jgi:hypothetical protein
MLIFEQKAHRGPRATPGGLRPQHPQRQRLATREEGGNEGGCKQLRKRPAANGRSLIGTAVSATEAPTNRGQLARTEHTSTQGERGHADMKQKGSNSHGMQKLASSSRAKRVNVQPLAHPRVNDSVTGQNIQEIQQQIRRMRTTWQRGFATEQEMLDGPPSALNAGVPASRGQTQWGDANLTIRASTEPMQRKRVPRHRVTERQFPREDTEEGVHCCIRSLQVQQRGPKGEGAAERVKM